MNLPAETILNAFTAEFGDEAKVQKVMEGLTEVERLAQPATEHIETVKQFIEIYPNLMTEFTNISKALKEILSINHKLKLKIVRDCASCGGGDYLILNVCSSEWDDKEVDLLDRFFDYNPDGLRISPLYLLSKQEVENNV